MFLEHVVFFLLRARRLVRAARNKPVGFSFDIADRCPIGCKCYWKALDRVEHMSLEDVVAFFKKLRRKGMLHATLVGGEPMVRPDVLRAVTEQVPDIRYMLVTSGTTPLEAFPNTTLVISVDGKDAETHNTVRGSKKLFERIITNLTKFRAEHGNEYPVFIHSTLNALNYQQVENILAYWKANGMVRGVMFSTWTDIEDAGDERFRLTDSQREEIVEELRRTKAQHGDFVVNSPYMIERLRPVQMRRQTPNNCSMSKLVASFRADGTRKPMCIFGPKAHCGTCGCASTQMVAGQRARDAGTSRAAALLGSDY